MRLTSCLQRLAKKMSPPLRKSSSSLSLDDPSLRLVFFDTETTSLIKPDILQLAAVDFTGTKKFQSLIMPRMKCMPGSVKIHGYRKRDDGKMYFRDEEDPVDARPPLEAYSNFMSWLRDEIGPKVLLVAYNGWRFDYKHMERLLPQFGQENFKDTIIGIADPLTFVRQGFKGEYKKTPKQDALLEDFNISRLGDSHDALNDSENLRRLTIKMVERLGYGTSENAVLQVLRSHKSIQLNQPGCQDCCAAPVEGKEGEEQKEEEANGKKSQVVD